MSHKPAFVAFLKGAELNARDADSGTPLNNAARNGNPEVVRSLLSAGADVNAWNKAGETPLDWAANGSNAAVAQMLRERGGRGGA